MRILVTNDDGVQADGLFALKCALATLGEVFVVAPERPRSAAGHAITLHKPVRLHKTELKDGSAAYAVSGTPADCVIIGAYAVMSHKVDMVISGINLGPNIGWDVHYSGTVAAAKEAAMIGYPAIAVSVASYDAPMHYATAAEFTARCARRLFDSPLPPRTLLNINTPNLPAEEIQGVAITFQGPRQYVDRVLERRDPSGRPYYWLGGEVANGQSPEGSDGEAILQNKISVTPLHLDLTAHNLIANLKEWSL